MLNATSLRWLFAALVGWLDQRPLMVAAEDLTVSAGLPEALKVIENVRQGLLLSMVQATGQRRKRIRTEARATPR